MSEPVAAVGVITGLSGVLAVLLVLADAWLADYGECRITINGGKRQLTVRAARRSWLP